MTNDNRSVHEIEREIERDRAQLTSNLENLQNKFSVDGVVQQLGDQLREHGGEIGNAITRTVKENPAAVVLTGVGLAWMIFGQGRSGASRSSAEQRGADYAGRARGREGYGSSEAYRDSGWEDRRSGSSYGGHDTSGMLVTRPDPRMKGGSEGVPSWARDDDEDSGGSSLADRASGAAASAQAKASAAGQAVHDKASAAGSAAKDAGAAAKGKAAAAGQAVRDGASSAASSVSDAADAARARAARLRDRLSEGTENLSEEARARVIAAREAAVDARRKAAGALESGSRQSADFFNRQPLVAGALALALGAAIGGALPRTRTEDDALGAHSDKMMERAEAIFREEQEKAVAVMQAARKEAETIASEKRDAMDSAAPQGKTAAQAAVDEAKSAGKRIAGAAADKAKEKDLGKPSSS
ncbi:DUF3618 domain-containing protein [Leisingera caerulea]|uniref:DUF3618 domain-containing protein n=1 Tax=Leisingera caerulea TaxID=506591 RepID=UPI0021A67369|nr:DUF3618 domain-containing protein [Leisingera caerulea]UWQ82939.1 DUF3618 domain-containing protein [Leisingera caerulea]